MLVAGATISTTWGDEAAIEHSPLTGINPKSKCHRSCVTQTSTTHENQVTYVHSLQMVGGLREEKAADEEVRNLVSKMKSQVEKLSNKTYKSLEPISYRTQVVAGMNYFIKVSDGGSVAFLFKPTGTRASESILVGRV